jgi:hypothetical protein
VVCSGGSNRRRETKKRIAEEEAAKEKHIAEEMGVVAAQIAKEKFKLLSSSPLLPLCIKGIGLYGERESGCGNESIEVGHDNSKKRTAALAADLIVKSTIDPENHNPEEDMEDEVGDSNEDTEDRRLAEQPT